MAGVRGTNVEFESLKELFTRVRVLLSSMTILCQDSLSTMNFDFRGLYHHHPGTVMITRNNKWIPATACKLFIFNLYEDSAIASI